MSGEPGVNQEKECKATLDIRNLPDNDIITDRQKRILWMRANIEEKIYIAYNVAPPHVELPGKWVVISFADPCFVGPCEGETDYLKAFMMLGEAMDTTEAQARDDAPKPGSASNSQSETGSTGTRSKSKTFCAGTPLIQVAKNAQNGVDATQTNNGGYQPAAVIPDIVAIPLRSNVTTYGPWATDNFATSCGGTEVVANTDLCPWVFGSHKAMDDCGKAIVASASIGLVQSETGSVTIPGLPDIANLGAAIAAGPSLTTLSVNFGSSGISTNYEFKTFTPKFGGLTRHAIDKLKNIQKNRQAQIKLLRTIAMEQNKIGRAIQRIDDQNARQRALGIGPALDLASLNRVFIGELYDWQTATTGSPPATNQRTVVGTETLYKSSVQMVHEYQNKAFMSFDGFFGPVSIAGDGGLPRFMTPDSHCLRGSPILPIPPYNTSSSSSITSMNNNNPTIKNAQENPLQAGHSIDLVGRGSVIHDSGNITNFFPIAHEDRYVSDYRFLGMRGPLVLHSWGYDTDGKPIPNKADTTANIQAGTVKRTELKNTFLDNHLGNPKTWPVGPIDLRFDRNRGVWVSPQAHKIVTLELIDDLKPHCYTDAKLITTYEPVLVKDDGTPETNFAMVKVVDRLGNFYPKDTRVYGYYDTYKCEYLILEATVEEKGEIVKFALFADKEVDDATVYGVLVDETGHPIDEKGEKLTNGTFAANKIILRDPFLNREAAIPQDGAEAPNGGQLGFGPALGSSDFAHHTTDSMLLDDGGLSPKQVGPFIGFARKISKNIPANGSSSCTTGTRTTTYDIVELQHFASYVTGKIATPSASIVLEGKECYGAGRNEYFDGVIPLGRVKANDSPIRDDYNLYVRFDQYIGLFGHQSYVVGDWDEEDIGDDPYVNVDGCVFTAMLDRVNSTCSKLIYNIVEAELLALVGSTKLMSQTKANSLNEDFITEEADDITNIDSTYSQGFQWSKTKSPTHYTDITIHNRPDWIGKSKFIGAVAAVGSTPGYPGSTVNTILTGIDENSNPIYTVVEGSTIAFVADATLKSVNQGAGVEGVGVYGHTDRDNSDERKVGTAAATIGYSTINFYDGLSPVGLVNNDLPKFSRPDGGTDTEQYMLFETSRVVGLWDETLDTTNPEGEISKGAYKIVHAQEAPVIITGTCAYKFIGVLADPVVPIQVNTALGSAQGSDKKPVTTLLSNIKNPLGYGAEVGDLVTLQRVWTNSVQTLGSSRSNYYYMVIGVGKPPALRNISTQPCS